VKFVCYLKHVCILLQNLCSVGKHFRSSTPPLSWTFIAVVLYIKLYVGFYGSRRKLGVLSQLGYPVFKSLIIGILINLRHLLKVFELAVNQVGIDVLLCDSTYAWEVAGSHLGQVTSFPELSFSTSDLVCPGEFRDNYFKEATTVSFRNLSYQPFITIISSNLYYLIYLA
jgi:hypothetical protein